MECEARIDALTSKHHELEEAIEDETQRPLPNSLRLLQLKREKLRIKEEITRLRHH